MINHHKGAIDAGLAKIQNGRAILKCPEFEKIFIKDRRSGREAVTVYKIKYILAWSRSGWYPHPRIRSRVGIREASKKM